MSKLFVFIGKLWLVFAIILSVFVVGVFVTVPLWGPWVIYSTLSEEEPKPPCQQTQRDALQYPYMLDDMSILSESGSAEHTPNF